VVAVPGTTEDYIQVSYSNDDSFEWFGGTDNGKHLIAFRGLDDEFDTDNGFSGHYQFLVSLRDPAVADVSNSNGLNQIMTQTDRQIHPYTSAVFSNVTFARPDGYPILQPLTPSSSMVCTFAGIPN